MLCTAVKWVSDPNNPQTCVGALAGCAVELALRCARRSDNHGESDNEACVSCGTHAHPATAPPQAQPEGVSHRTAIRAIAALGPAAQTGPSAAMAREDARLWVPFRMRRGAQVLADQGSRLFE